jgi:lipopolysaccharide transport system ATP-binding protein
MGLQMSSDSAIAVLGVSKRYPIFEQPLQRALYLISPRLTGVRKEHWALRNTSFDVASGESLAVIGKNGSGKSTLLQIIAGTLQPTTGRALVRGRVAALLELGSGFSPQYTGRENVYLNGAILGLRKKEVDAKFSEIESFADIGDYIDEQVRTYSNGMLVRLAFSVQAVLDPDILIIDEALGVGDVFFQQKCAQRIRDLQENGVTILLVSHDMSLVRNLCRRAVLLRAGQAVFIGDVNEAAIQYFHEESVGPSTRGERDSQRSFSGKAGNPTNLHSRASIVGVRLTDASDADTTTFEIGGEMFVRVVYASEDAAPVDVSVVLKNSLGQTLCIVGSYTKGVTPPIPEKGREVLCIVAMTMTVEAGLYSVEVQLGSRSSHINTGELLDHASFEEPVRVTWDYQARKPPFFGMVGLEHRVSFH